MFRRIGKDLLQPLTKQDLIIGKNNSVFRHLRLPLLHPFPFTGGVRVLFRIISSRELGLNDVFSMLCETPSSLSLPSHSGCTPKDMTMTGMLGYFSFMCQRRPNPSITGILRSVIIRSTGAEAR